MSDLISFGDKVRVRAQAETQLAGIAGRIGQVYGLTMPSVTGVEVIGAPRRDYAIKVYFVDTEESHWLAEELLDLVDHGEGTTITFDGIDKKWIRKGDGNWGELKQSKSRASKPWWRFWR